MNIEVKVGEIQSKASEASNLLKTMANKWRLLILCHLSLGEKSVGEIEKLVDLNQSALSQHLAILRREHLVKTRKVAQTVYYSLANEDAPTIMHALHEVFRDRQYP